MKEGAFLASLTTVARLAAQRVRFPGHESEGSLGLGLRVSSVRAQFLPGGAIGSWSCLTDEERFLDQISAGSSTRSASGSGRATRSRSPGTCGGSDGPRGAASSSSLDAAALDCAGSSCFVHRRSFA